jgi:hypothetical protein
MRSSQTIIAEWRESWRQLAALPPLHADRRRLQRDVDRLRTEYLALFAAHVTAADDLAARRIVDASDGVLAQITELRALIEERKGARGLHRKSLDAAIASASGVLLEQAIVEQVGGSAVANQPLSIDTVAKRVLHD